MFEDDDSVFAAMRAGARGYPERRAEGGDVARDSRGGQWRGHLQSGYCAAADDVAPAPPPSVLTELTERERDVLQLIARGKSNEAIASRLSLSLKTVRIHVSNIYAKLQVVDRTQAALRARDAGLVLQ